MEDSDNFDVFDGKDRSQFLFKVFSHITLGGPINQVNLLVLLGLNTS